jgi:putative transposase
MKRKHTAEQIVLMLRKIESAQAQGKALALACKEAGISEWTFYHWRKQYGGISK